MKLITTSSLGSTTLRDWGSELAVRSTLEFAEDGTVVTPCGLAQYISGTTEFELDDYRATEVCINVDGSAC